MADAEGVWKVWFCERGLLHLTSLFFLEFPPLVSCTLSRVLAQDLVAAERPSP